MSVKPAERRAQNWVTAAGEPLAPHSMISLQTYVKCSKLMATAHPRNMIPGQQVINTQTFSRAFKHASFSIHTNSGSKTSIPGALGEKLV
jgi:hypothetical protein